MRDDAEIWIDGAPLGNELAASPLTSLVLVNYGHFTAMQVRGGAVRGLREHLTRVAGAHRELFGQGLDLELVRSRWAEAARSRPDADLRAVFSESPDGRTQHLIALRPPFDGSMAPQRLRSVGYVRPLVPVSPSVEAKTPGGSTPPAIESTGPQPPYPPAFGPDLKRRTSLPLVKRRGKLKALVAVARSILVIIWHLLADPHARYHDLGADHHTTRINKDRKTRSLIHQLEALGHTVTLQPTVTTQPPWHGSAPACPRSGPFSDQEEGVVAHTPLGGEVVPPAVLYANTWKHMLVPAARSGQTTEVPFGPVP